MQLDAQKHEVSQYLRSAHANRHAEAYVSRCMNTRYAEGQVNVETHQGHSKTWLREREKEVRCFRSIDVFRRPINCREVPKDCPEEKESSFRVLISPDQFIQDTEVGFWDLTSRMYLVLVLLRENLVVVLVLVCRSLLPQMPPASPIEDRGTAIPIEDRDWAIPERLRLCGVIVKGLPVSLMWRKNDSVGS
ncbi:hypothetical protein DY000_02053924 [Brassica cretica]|uniref:Uncharacterized protein n=1 Tax=Brassica cretica TaxID=69181 RepID=A0ABQ7ADR9_BRACR|nr:hypothetical protein DY000_02053924 [Brassica cretica]